MRRAHTLCTAAHWPPPQVLEVQAGSAVLIEWAAAGCCVSSMRAVAREVESTKRVQLMFHMPVPAAQSQADVLHVRSCDVCLDDPAFSDHLHLHDTQVLRPVAHHVTSVSCASPPRRRTSGGPLHPLAAPTSRWTRGELRSCVSEPVKQGMLHACSNLLTQRPLAMSC